MLAVLSVEWAMARGSCVAVPKGVAARLLGVSLHEEGAGRQQSM